MVLLVVASMFSWVDSIAINESAYLVSCYQATNTNLTGAAYCSHVSWGSANLYSKQQYTVYNPGQPLSDTQQSELARQMSADLLSASAPSADCKQVMQWFTCSDAFPYCPISGASASSVSYLPTCRFHCDLAKSLCAADSLDCSGYANGNCNLYVPTGYFLIPPDQGPTDSLAGIYLYFVGFWAACFVIWFVMFLVYCSKPIPPPVPAMGLVYAFRACACFVTGRFWEHCSSYLGMCTFEEAYTAMTILQALEACVYMVVVYVVRNVAFTTKLTLQDTAAAWFLDLVFFIISYALRSVIIRAPTAYWIVMISLLYFFIFYTIVSVASHEWRRMLAICERLTDTMPAHITKQIRLKAYLHEHLMVVSLLLLALEITCQSMFALNVPVRTLLLFYEVTVAILLVYMGWLFRPRKWSPFFYLEPAATAAATNAIRPISVLRVQGMQGDEDNDKQPQDTPFEVELTPLLRDTNNSGDRHRISMLRQPDGDLQIGL